MAKEMKENLMREEERKVRDHEHIRSRSIMVDLPNAVSSYGAVPRRAATGNCPALGAGRGPPAGYLIKLSGCRQQASTCKVITSQKPSAGAFFFFFSVQHSVGIQSSTQMFLCRYGFSMGLIRYVIAAPVQGLIQNPSLIMLGILYKKRYYSVQLLLRTTI